MLGFSEVLVLSSLWFILIGVKQLYRHSVMLYGALDIKAPSDNATRNISVLFDYFGKKLITRQAKSVYFKYKCYINCLAGGWQARISVQECFSHINVRSSEAEL